MPPRDILPPPVLVLKDIAADLVIPPNLLAIDRHQPLCHMAPAGDRGTDESMAQSFSLANMVPQAPLNNRTAWADIEKATRKYVLRAAGDVFIITGPVFDGQPPTIGAHEVWVPQHLFKLVYDPSTGRAWVHWLDNTDTARAGKPISYAELVQRTGIDFMPAFAGGQQRR